MKVKLSNEDRCAIDIVLEERAAGAPPLDQCFNKSGAASLVQRVGQVEKLLALLDQMPAQEPSAGLLADTLKYVKKHSHVYPAAHAPAPRAAVTSQVSSHRTLH